MGTEQRTRLRRRSHQAGRTHRQPPGLVRIRGASRCPGSRKNLLVNNAGYPVDKPLGTQWFNAGRIQEVKPNTLTYGLDTEPGQSGSPVFYFDEDLRRIVVAVHTYGTSGDNIGVRITPDLYAQMTEWVA